MQVFGATIIPRHKCCCRHEHGWNDAKTAIRREVNQWIRTRAPFDGVLDFDAAVRDPPMPTAFSAVQLRRDPSDAARLLRDGQALPLDRWRAEPGVQFSFRRAERLNRARGNQQASVTPGRIQPRHQRLLLQRHDSDSRGR